MSEAHGEGGKKAIVAAFLANLGIAVSKFVAFAFTGSASMLAEGIHSIADTGNQGLLMLGGRRAQKAATAAHPFGFGAERYFSAFLVAMVLFTLGAAFAVFEGVNKILHPHELESAVWAFCVLGLAILLEAYSFRTAVHEANAVRGDLSIAAFIRRSKAPEIPVVLLEDMAALSGLTIALAAVILAEVTGKAVFDGIGTLAIGILLGVVAVILGIEMKSLLLGEAATPRDVYAIRNAMAGNANVEHVIDIRTMHLGPDSVLVTAKLEFGGGLSFEGLAKAIDEVEADVRAAVPKAKIIYIEPDVLRSQT